MSKNVIINVRVTTEEKLAAQAEAKRRDEPLSQAIRRFLRGYISGRGETGQPS